MRIAKKFILITLFISLCCECKNENLKKHGDYIKSLTENYDAMETNIRFRLVPVIKQFHKSDTLGIVDKIAELNQVIDASLAYTIEVSGGYDSETLPLKGGEKLLADEIIHEKQLFERIDNILTSLDQSREVVYKSVHSNLKHDLAALYELKDGGAEGVIVAELYALLLNAKYKIWTTEMMYYNMYYDKNRNLEEIPYFFPSDKY